MFKAIKRMRRQEVVLLIFSILLVLAQVWTEMKIPDYMSSITMLVQTEGSEMSAIWKAGGVMMLLALLSTAIGLSSGYISAMLGGLYSKHLRSDIFNKVQSFSLNEIDRFSTASLITRSTNDITQLQMFISGGLRMIIRTPISVVVALIKIWGKHWQWTSLTGGAIIAVMVIVVIVIRYAHPRFRKMQDLTDELNKATRENLTGIRVIRAYNAEEYQEKKFEEANENLSYNMLAAQTVMSSTRPFMRFVNDGLTIGIYLIGAYLINKTVGTTEALVTFSEMVVFSNYASRLLMSFMNLEMIFNMIPRASVAAERINEVLDCELEITDGPETNGIEGMEGTVEFRNVSFTYPGTEGEVLSDISFTAKKGETVAFIGATGSGKTSLVNLIPRFYDTTKGEVIVDGRDVREYNQHSLRNLIGYAPQTAVLFSGTVSSNIEYGVGSSHAEDEDSEAEVKRAVAIAQAAEFVEKMENTYDAVITRGGTNVSGGQRQRLSVARVVYRKPEIYIFDDTFSALDFKTDRILRAALKEETEGVTTLIVAQRIGTIRDADKIIVLDEGKIVGMGTHEELMRKCQVYREIAYTQLSEEELA
ncbi:MAG: ABC transporter ATP-binding protein [Oscillospiraceae bacterium]|nr:ABC transporter ATP-binding protein [Oscillospiraceae bacterium]